MHHLIDLEVANAINHDRLAIAAAHNQRAAVRTGRPSRRNWRRSVKSSNQPR